MPGTTALIERLTKCADGHETAARVMATRLDDTDTWGVLHKARASDLRAALSLLTTQAAEITRLEALLNTPELHDFSAAVMREAAHQRERWGVDHDGGKTNEDWFWLIGYLAGKALHSAKNGDDRKALHHTISTAATLANWHAALNGDNRNMRPGIAPPISLKAELDAK